jgi:hypothetical protein
MSKPNSRPGSPGEPTEDAALDLEVDVIKDLEPRDTRLRLGGASSAQSGQSSTIGQGSIQSRAPRSEGQTNISQC